MIFFQHTKKRTLLLWTLLLSTALLCAQGVKLHVHNYDHDYGQQHGNASVEEAVSHTHLSVAHFSTDTSHADHHEDVVSEIDASQSGVLSKVSGNTFQLALLVAALLLLIPCFYRYAFLPRRENTTRTPSRYDISPPLRAPPL